MKNKQLLSFLLTLSMLTATILSGCTKETEPTVYDPSLGTNDSVLEIPVYQAKLDQIDNPAYTTTSSLSIEPGSYLSYLGKENNTSYSNELEAGIKQAISDLNEKLQYTSGDSISYSYNGPKNPNDTNEQINILDAELARYPLALSIAPLDNNAYLTQFDLAQDNGIQLVAFDTSSTQLNATTVIGTNSVLAMNDAVTHITSIAEAEEPYEIVILTNNATKPIIDTLIDSVKTYLEENETEYTLSKVINTDTLSILYPTSETPVVSEPATLDELLTPEITLDNTVPSVGYITTDSTTCEQLLDYLDSVSDEADESDTPSNYSIVSFDANDRQQDALRSGQIDGLILRNPFAIGYATVIASVRSAMAIGNQAYVDTGHTLITTDNLDSKEIQTLLY